MARTVHRQCTLCEAHCGIDVEVEGDRVLRITGDAQDPISRGYICPKAAALADLYADPDRLRRPVRRVGSEWVPVGWDEALDLAADGLRAVQRRHGDDAVATYFGNPSAHTMAVLSGLPMRHVLNTRNHYSATSADQLPQHLTSAEMFGNLALFPIPDIDRTDYMLVLGANPSVSNGSLMTAPGARHRLRAIVARGGSVVVVDPRRTETAAHASEHVAIAPGGDPYLLLGMLHVLFAEGRTRLGHLQGHADGIATIEALAADWPVARAAPIAGVDEATVPRLAREFADAERAVAYGRVGVCHQRTGSLTHWLINVLNAVTGNLDVAGGAMFPNPAFDVGAVLKRARLLGFGDHGRHTQRVSGLPEMNGELPVAGLADEITTPGEGQVRGMLIFAGNPVLSTPGGARLEEALATLEWCVAVDMYVTETTRHADVILPPVSTLERSDIDVVMPLVSVRNHIRYSPAAVPKPKDGREDWQILTALTSRLGRGVGRRAEAAVASLPAAFTTPERIIDLAIALGPHGVLRRGPLKGLTVAKIKRAKHGIDLGPLEARLPGALDTADNRVQLAPPVLVEEAAKLAEHAREREDALSDGYDLTLIGRRQLRSNNSWMHNSARLMKGADRCTALLHPDDAGARGLDHGDQVRVVSRVGAIELPLEVSDEIRPGVVSVPHGFGHARPGVGWRLAAEKAGASVNDITDPSVVDAITGNAAFNAVPVRVEAARASAPTQ
jgi:anaerobic selenocysteine-containing dehydrogenase